MASVPGILSLRNNYITMTAEFGTDGLRRLLRLENILQGLRNGSQISPNLQRTHQHLHDHDADYAPIAVTGPTTVFKAADETVNNSTTLQDDDDLLLAVGANEVWAFELLLHATSNSSSTGFKFDFAIPSGAAGFHITHADGNNAGVDGEPETFVVNNLATDVSVTTSTTDPDFRVILIKGTIDTAGTAGNMQFRWAQNTATAEDTTVKAGSWLIGHKLA